MRSTMSSARRMFAVVDLEKIKVGGLLELKTINVPSAGAVPAR